MPEHDPMLCFCGTPKGCACPCTTCVTLHDSELGITRRRLLLENLDELEIDIADLAECIWMEIEKDIEARIEQLTTAIVRQTLRRLVLKSSVEWDNIR